MRNEILRNHRVINGNQGNASCNRHGEFIYFIFFIELERTAQRA